MQIQWIASLILMVLVVIQWFKIRTLNSELNSKKAECKRLSELASSDSLTGLLNRRAYDEVIERFKSSFSGGEHNRENGLKSLGFIMIDVDFFKQVNDNHGHDTGDEVLMAVAEAIKGSLRHSDLIFRMGGDEFSALIPNINNVGIRRLAEKVRKSVAGLTFAGDIKVTTSIGGAIAQNEAEFKELSRLADQALYKAKNKGRNFFQLS